MHEAPLVVVTGGGTGGHLYPALAVADALRARRPDVRVLFVGAQRGLEARVLPARGERHLLLPIRGAARGELRATLGAIPGVFVSLARVARAFRDDRPELVVVTGGYAAAPAGLMASVMGIPLALQEQNSVPGVVSRFLARWASRAYVAFPEALDRLSIAAPRGLVTGNPVRAGAPKPRAETRAVYGVPVDARLVMLSGGSQGSLALNIVLSDVVRAVTLKSFERPENLHVLWVTGPNNLADVTRHLEQCGAPAWVHAVGYVDDFPSALAAADLAISRAGAMSTAELLLRGLPSILVPLPSAAADHQTHNARALEHAGAALMLQQRGLTAQSLWSTVTGLLADEARLASMRRAALSLARPTAADDIARDLVTLLPPPATEHRGGVA